MSEVREMKRVEDSETEQSHLLFPRSLNANGRLFGGQLLDISRPERSREIRFISEVI